MREQLSRTVVRYTIFGALFGLAFPLVATLLDVSISGLPLGLAAALQVQSGQPLHWIIDLAPFVLGFMGWLAGWRQDALERMNRQLSSTVDARTAELRQTNEVLRRRATQLDLIIQIMRRLSAILDRHELVKSVVEIIGKSLDYYHVHIYLFDEDRQYLLMSGGTGEVGRKLALKGHRIPRGKGLVGRAAETNLPVVVPDVKQDSGWLPNPLLPDTRSEVAVPIRRGERLLGVLDVQHDVTGGLNQEDARTLQLIADQIAVALENAQLYAQVQRRVDQEVLLNTITQKIQSTTDIDDALQVAVRELGRALHGAPTAVRLTKPPAAERLRKNEAV